MANDRRYTVPTLGQLKLAWILSLVPANATREEFQDIKTKAEPLFEAAMESERAKAYNAGANDRERDMKTGGTTLNPHEFEMEGDSDD